MTLLAVACSSGGDGAGRTPTRARARVQVRAPSPTHTLVPPTDTPLPLPDRQSCDEMRGTQYRSLAEREFFIANCITPSPTAPPALVSAVVVPPAPVADGRVAGLRVWSDGDSTSYFMSVAFLQMMVGMGAVQAQAAPEYQISSGLLNSNYFDWPAYLSTEIAARDPDVVVFMIGANDAYAGMPLDTYHQLVGAVMDQLSDRTVIWVGQPNMGRADLHASIPSVNAVFQDEASGRPWVVYVDAWALTSDADGNYAQYLPDESGVVQQIRADDGVHLTTAGGRRLALAVVDAVLNTLN